MLAGRQQAFQQVENIRTSVRDIDTYGLRRGTAAYGHCFASRKGCDKESDPRFCEY